MIHPSTGPQPGELIRRLRAWSFSSWQHGDRIAVARLAGQQLADLAADAEGRPHTAVPELSFTALADQLAVLFNDATTAGAGDEGAALLATLAADLGLGRRGCWLAQSRFNVDHGSVPGKSNKLVGKCGL